MMNILIKKIKLEVSFKKTYLILSLASACNKLEWIGIADKLIEKSRALYKTRELLLADYIKAVEDSLDQD